MWPGGESYRFFLDKHLALRRADGSFYRSSTFSCNNVSSNSVVLDSRLVLDILSPHMNTARRVEGNP